MNIDTIKVCSQSAKSGYTVINKCDLLDGQTIYSEASTHGSSEDPKEGSVPWIKSEIERFGGEFTTRNTKPELEEILKGLQEE